MGKGLKLKNRDLRQLGYTQGTTIGLLIAAARKHFPVTAKQEALLQLELLLEKPEVFLEHEVFGEFAAGFWDTKQAVERNALKPVGRSFEVFGAALIDPATLEQMNVAMRLPVAVAGALMPDAHVGYGLPIGGVLATENQVIPYGVGVDIGCRMCLSVYAIEDQEWAKYRSDLRELLLAHTRFGMSAFERPKSHPILEHALFREIKTLKNLRQKAVEQIGTSGSGNHFVDFGIVEVSNFDPALGLSPGRYLGLLSHSGSRALGAGIAQHYTKVAMDTCVLPKTAKHLAWLELDSEAGAEYWLAMNLAGDYAAACHHQIHDRISQALGESCVARVENHHNFAWKEKQHNGQELIVHRKGATPAGVGQLGIIPGSMTSPGFIVKGKGEISSLSSASHGAGRLFSRSGARSNFTQAQMNEHLKSAGVQLLGGGLDEAPFAYKDIRQVMALQQDLVDILGVFEPKVVRMEG